MQSRSNVFGTISLVSSIVLLVIWFLRMCAGFIPIINMIALLLFPILFVAEWLLAFASVITGILGFRAAAALDGAGRTPSIVGAVIATLWALLQLALYALAIFLGGSFFLLSLISGNS